MGEIGKKAILITATIIVALMFIIPASGRAPRNSAESFSRSSVPAAGSGAELPPRRRRMLARRRWRRVHRARAWRRHERFERRHGRWRKPSEIQNQISAETSADAKARAASRSPGGQSKGVVCPLLESWKLQVEATCKGSTANGAAGWCRSTDLRVQQAAQKQELQRLQKTLLKRGRSIPEPTSPSAGYWSSLRDSCSRQERLILDLCWQALAICGADNSGPA